MLRSVTPHTATFGRRDRDERFGGERAGSTMASNAHVAIDGPVASGKTTVAKRLAKHLGSLYLDTGAMYRALSLAALRTATDVDNEAGLAALLERVPISIVPDFSTEIGYRVFLDGREVDDRLFGSEVTAVVSTVAAHPRVREGLVVRQRAIADGGNVVMAGRDIGTIVLPQARFKFFLTASLDERVRRRGAELVARAIDVDLGALRAQVVERDRLDASRPTAPLRAAEDAEIIDSTGMDSEAVVATMLRRIAPVAP